MRRLGGIAAALAVGLGLALAGAGAEAGGGRKDATGQITVEVMSAETAHRLAAEGKLVLVDIRPSGFWEIDGVPEHAETVDYTDPMFFELIDLIVEGDHSIPVALICNAGVRTEQAAIELTRRGYARAIDVAEGIKGAKEGPGWIAHGLPMVRP